VSIVISSSHCAFAGKSFANGRDKARDALLADPNLRAALVVENVCGIAVIGAAERRESGVNGLLGRNTDASMSARPRP
jgi:hypothetical protein